MAARRLAQAKVAGERQAGKMINPPPLHPSFSHTWSVHCSSTLLLLQDHFLATRIIRVENVNPFPFTDMEEIERKSSSDRKTGPPVQFVLRSCQPYLSLLATLISPVLSNYECRHESSRRNFRMQRKKAKGVNMSFFFVLKSRLHFAVFPQLRPLT